MTSRPIALVASGPPDIASNVPTPQGALRVVPSEPVKTAADFAEMDMLEAGLTGFDPDGDIESIVPMPPTIPRALRRVLTRAFADRFEHSEDLDAWLHLPHPALEGETPFERVVEGDGWGVLRALVGKRSKGGESVERRASECDRNRPSGSLQLVP